MENEGGAPTVVLVDDEPDLLFLLERTLGRAGFEVVGTARNGQDGIRCTAKAKPDAVLLDLVMPGMDGEEALPRMVRESPTTMIAILSAHLDSELAEELLNRGAFAAYEKGDLAKLPSVLRDDLESFHRALDGHSTVPPWKRRYREL